MIRCSPEPVGATNNAHEGAHGYMAQGKPTKSTPSQNGKSPLDAALLSNPWGDDGHERRSGERAGQVVAAVAGDWVETIRAVVTAGMGLTVSGTRDGGAVCVALLRDGTAAKKYAGDPEELSELLARLRDYLGSLD